MKHIQKVFLTFLLLIGLCISANTFAANISLVDVFDTNTLSVSLSEKNNLPEGVLNGEIKVLKDTTIEDAVKSIDDAKKVTLTLPYSLEIGVSYSLLTLFGAEGSIDFTTGEELIGQQIDNQDIIGEEQTIESITIIDETTLEVIYTSDVIDSTFEYKLLSELNVTSIENTTNEDTRITLHLEKTIVPEKDYILIVLSLTDMEGEEVELENSIFDFMSPAYIEDQIAVQISDEALSEQISDETESDNTDIQDSITAKIEARNAAKALEQEQESQQQELEVELTAAGPEVDASKVIQNVAMSADSTPKTGAETWVLLFLTLVINGFYHFSSRKIA